MTSGFRIVYLYLCFLLLHCFFLSQLLTCFVVFSCCFPAFAFDEHTRLVLFREREWRDRRLLFDSEELRGRRCSEGNWRSKSSKCVRMDFSGAKSVLGTKKDEDAKREETLFGEMIFGAIAMSFKGDTLKVHQFKNPLKIMLTKVFPVCRHTRSRQATSSEFGTGANISDFLQESDSDGHVSAANSFEGTSYAEPICRSIPLDVPEKAYKSPVTSSPTLQPTSRSWFGTISSDYGSAHNSLSSSLKRYYLNQATSFHSRFSRRSDDSLEDSEMNLCSSGRIQFGLGIIFSFTDERSIVGECVRKFLQSHIHIVELEASRLQKSFERAYLSKTLFSRVIWKIWYSFIAAIQTLYDAPRLSHPAWISLMENNCGNLVSERFLRTFVLLAEQYDVKKTNFFISTLITVSLMNHVTWVSSVAPPCVPMKCLTKNGRIPQWRKSMENYAHPYNPYLAQMLDIWGAVASPCRLSRTLVLGNNRDLVLQILFLLSYFARCSRLNQRPADTMDNDISCLYDLLTLKDNNGLELSADGVKFAKATRQNPLLIRRMRAAKDSTSSDKQKHTRPDSLFTAEVTSKPRRHTLSQSTFRPVHCRSRKNLFVKPESGHGERLSLQCMHDLTGNVKRSWCQQHGCPCSTSYRRHSEKVARCDCIPDVYRSISATEVPSVFKVPALPDGNPRYWLEYLATSHTSLLQKFNLHKPSPASSGHGMMCDRCLYCDCQCCFGPGEYPLKSPVCNCCQNVLNTENSCSCISAADLHSQVPLSSANLPAGKVCLYQRIFGGSRIEDMSVSEMKSSQLHEPQEPLKKAGELSSDAFNPGVSLQAGFTERYCPYFTLSGLNYSPNIYLKVQDDMKSLVSNEVLSPEPVIEAVCVIANTCDWTVRVVSSSSGQQLHREAPCLPSKFISDMVEQVKLLGQMNLAADFCVAYIEDCLADVYAKSCALATLLEEKNAALDSAQAAKLLNCDISDIPLLMSVAAVYSPDNVASLKTV